MCFDTCFLDTYLHRSLCQCHNTYLPASSGARGKRSFPTATKLFHIHLDFLHSPTLLLQLCNNLPTVRLLAVISFLCTPASWLYFCCFLCILSSLGQPSFCSLPIQFPALRGTKPWGRHLTLPYGKLGAFRNLNYQCNTNQTNLMHNKFWRVPYSSAISCFLCPSLSPPSHCFHFKGE